METPVRADDAPQLAGAEPLSLMPWECATLGAANVADFLREVQDEMDRMPREGRDDRELQRAAEASVMAVWQAETTARGELAYALTVYTTTHFDKDEDDD